MSEAGDFYYNPEETEKLSTAVVKAVAKAHDEDVLEQKWRISDDINADALNSLFDEPRLNTVLQFKPDTTTATISVGRDGTPRIKIESHR